MAKRGGKRRYDTPKALRAAVEEYIAVCEEGGVFPDLAGMRLALGLSQKSLEALTEGDTAQAEEFREVLDYARDTRESWLVRRMTGENKLAQNCLNLLKQPANGGYADKPLDSGERTLTINLLGVGKEAFQ